ncbi:hypothetical protein RRG08_037690 [Elysia crispata]|uniref:Uncharacterized protein n=1 Tax=Elysia crispata TaxID=231223 RepID=A0AAE1DU28_9GAST|nr:hypothetical protein RRG08_037690 [Elysia crispata]
MCLFYTLEKITSGSHDQSKETRHPTSAGPELELAHARRTLNSKQRTSVTETNPVAFASNCIRKRNHSRKQIYKRPMAAPYTARVLGRASAALETCQWAD